VTADTLTLRRPDDWHVHLRDGAMLQAVLPYTARAFARAIVMPNLAPPVTSVAAAEAYRARILAAVPAGVDFTPLMTAYLTDGSDADEIERGYRAGVFAAVKLYPARATTNSAAGVTDVAKTYLVLERLAAIGMPLLIHGEVVDPDIDVFDREAVFIERVLAPLTRRLPQLKIVLEHITTKEAVDFVSGASPNVAATVTAHHLVINRNALFAGGLRPHLYCLPVAKREAHRPHCAAPRPRAPPNSSSAPTRRPTSSRTRSAIAAAPASSRHRRRWRSTPRSLPRRMRSTASRRSPRSTGRASMGSPRMRRGSRCAAGPAPSRRR
jgi:dihydroorotase